jgi:hypothetical protein
MEARPRPPDHDRALFYFDASREWFQRLSPEHRETACRCDGQRAQGHSRDHGSIAAAGPQVPVVMPLA